MKPLCLALLLPGAAWADAPMTGREFERFSQGKTLSFTFEGKLWGHERYLPDHQVVWQFATGACRYGFWRAASEGLICFSYRDDPFDVQCGWFFAKGTGATLRDMGLSETAPLVAVEVSDQVLNCPNAEAGV